MSILTKVITINSGICPILVSEVMDYSPSNLINLTSYSDEIQENSKEYDKIIVLDTLKSTRISYSLHGSYSPHGYGVGFYYILNEYICLYIPKLSASKSGPPNTTITLYGIPTSIKKIGGVYSILISLNGTSIIYGTLTFNVGNSDTITSLGGDFQDGTYYYLPQPQFLIYKL